MRPRLTFARQNSRGFSLPEVLLVTAMVLVVAGFVVVSLVRANRTTDRTTIAIEIANYLQKAPDRVAGSSRDRGHFGADRTKRVFPIPIRQTRSGNN